jgi:hypothetical protein
MARQSNRSDVVGASVVEHAPGRGAVRELVEAVEDVQDDLVLGLQDLGGGQGGLHSFLRIGWSFRRACRIDLRREYRSLGRAVP